MMPRPKIVDWCNAPPEKIATKLAARPAADPSVDVFSKYENIATWSMPGIGIQKPIR